jgi:pilus assembly protein FimV
MNMFWRSTLAVALLWFVASSKVLALGLGGIEIDSVLNNPLRAVVELTSATDTEIEELKVSIASSEAFARAGITRTRILNDFNFSVERTSAGKPVIRISTTEPVREAFLEFLLEAPAPPAVSVRPAPAPPPTRQARPAPPPPPVAPAPVPARTTDQYGPVRRSETLWDIAKKLRPGSDISMQQMMLALQRANPAAFIHNNINYLRAGAVLQVPERDEVLALSRSDAVAEARRQYDEWRRARSGATGGSRISSRGRYRGPPATDGP